MIQTWDSNCNPLIYFASFKSLQSPVSIFSLKDLLVYLKIQINILITEEKNNQYETMRIVIKELVRYGKLDPKIPFIEKVKLHKSDRILKALCQSICDEISKDE